MKGGLFRTIIQQDKNYRSLFVRVLGADIVTSLLANHPYLENCYARKLAVGLQWNCISFMNKGMLKEINTNIRPKLECTSLVWSPFFEEIYESENKGPLEGNKDRTFGNGAELQGEDSSYDLPMLEYRRKWGNIITFFMFLNQSDNVDREQFFKISRER